MSKRRKSGKQENERFKKKGKKPGKKAGTEYEGIAQMNRDGNLFIKVEGLEDDIFVRASKSHGALHGDSVRVALRSARRGPGAHREGEILHIIRRNDKPFVGVLHRLGAQAWAIMQSKNMPYDIEIGNVEDYPDAQSGYKVAVKVSDWPRGHQYPQGEIVDVLGEMGKNDTEMHAILTEFGLPYRFNKEVEDAAEAIPAKISPEDLKGRRDFRKTLTFTIDPADAKDFDDALSFVPLANGNYEVGVHIADVSWYVKPGSIIDKEAQERGTSVYLVDRTVPMLPEKLCNNLCSLRPGEDKLTFSAVFEITPGAKLVSGWFGRTVINSDYRFNYEQAQEIIEESFPGEKKPEVKFPKEIKQAIVTLWGLADILRKNRFAAGAISFERPEMKVDVDAEGRPIGVHQHISREANWLIEEFMLLANRKVAEFVATGGKMDGKARKDAKTFVYRIHDLPNADKIHSLKTFAGTFGYKTDLGEGGGDKVALQLNSLLSAAKDKPEFMALEMVALRAMAKACYSTDNIGHYGLAFRFYTHFTSPIRRYPDLMVHRLLSLYLEGGKSQDKLYFEGQCEHASEREVIAANAERDSIKYKLVEYMMDKIDQEYDGHISGLTEWGMYVEIEPTKIEGMVSLREIKSDFYVFDEQKYRIFGRRTHKIYRLGDPVRIKVKRTNLEQRILDYELIEDPLSETPDKKPKGRRNSPGENKRKKQKDN